MAPAAARRPGPVVSGAALLGTLDPARSTTLVRVHVPAFLDRFLRGRPAPLLDAPSPRYPEVEFRRPCEAGSAGRPGSRTRYRSGSP
ncbi:hypothetical protein [Streptomyces sp. C10-9-1]|uniref:hypothetical protein n=1 Tax=Streptomyces sp. C10-9-1 TaxID=1859285 RepID=UPI003D755435